MDLSHRRITGSIEFRDLKDLKILNLEAILVEGTLTISRSPLDELNLRGARVAGDITIRDSVGDHAWIDDNPPGETCRCANQYGQLKIGNIDAASLSAGGFAAYGIISGSLDLTSAKIERVVRLNRDRFDSVDLHYLRAIGIEINSSVISQLLRATLVQIDGDISLECSTVGEKFKMWGSDIGGQLHLEGTRFKDSSISAFRSKLGQLTFGAATGTVNTLRLERSKIGVLRLTDGNCPRQPELYKVQTSGMVFGWVQGSLEKSFARTFFDQAQENDPIAYRKLANAYAARGDHDAADEALVYQNRFLGLTRQAASSIVGPILAIVLWIAPVFAWSIRDWPTGAKFLDRLILAADLLLPDIVALGARERYQEDVQNLSGWNALILAIYRLLGWVIISVIIYVIAERGSY